MPDQWTNAVLAEILAETKTIAMVGASTNPIRPSFFVATYFNSRGKRIIPVNPALVGQSLFGEPFVGCLADIPANRSVQMVNIFRRGSLVPELVDEAVAHLAPGLRTIWMQFGVESPEGAAKAKAAGLNVVENRCPKVDHMRLSGALTPAGLKTGLISSRLPRRA